MKRILPTWCKEVKKSMIDDDINVTELAERVGFSRNYVSGVVNGRVYAPEIAKVIGEDRHVIHKGFPGPRNKAYMAEILGKL